jgi:DNA-binding XRE family transcriptional regulator
MDTGAKSSGRIIDAARTFGDELRRRRSQAGLTQRELAELVRYSRETVAAVECGRRYATRCLAVRSDEVLGTGGVLGRLWPWVERAQLAADRRRGPRPTPPAGGWPAMGAAPAQDLVTELADWVATIRPAIDQAPPEFVVRLRDLVNNLAPAR